MSDDEIPKWFKDSVNFCLFREGKPRTSENMGEGIGCASKLTTVMT